MNDSLRTKVGALDRELTAKNELVANLRGENELLDEWRRDAKGTLEDMAKRQQLGDITMPKLPAPLDSALKSFAEAHPSEVIYDAAHGTVKWKGDLLFPLGSDEVRGSSMESLRGFADVLKSAAAADFETIIVGHTDTRPVQRPETKAKHPTNWHLSTHRAIAVGNVMQKYGYPAERVGCMGCSEYRPVAETSSEAGQSQNRRVEIYLVPTGSIVPPAQRLVPAKSRPNEAEPEAASALAKPKP
jgi:chemotaxis protein MotB